MAERDNGKKKSVSHTRSRYEGDSRSRSGEKRTTAASGRNSSKDWREMAERQDKAARRERERIAEEKENTEVRSGGFRGMLDAFDVWYENLGKNWGNNIRVMLGMKKKRHKKPPKYADSTMRKRNTFIMVIMALCFVALVGFLAYYQLIDRERWQQLAVEQQLKDTVLEADRGSIYDANMQTLVQSRTAWKVWIKKSSLKDEHKDAVVQMLAEVLELDEEYIYDRLSLNYSDISLNGKADKTQRDAILDFTTDEEGDVVIPGIYMIEDTERYYASADSSLASTVLGFTNDSNVGAAGLELQYNDTLSGVPGRQIVAMDAKSDTAMPYGYKKMIDAQEGSSLVLTIDQNVQSWLEEALWQAVKDNDVRNRACGIIMNVNNGEILAMASIPDYDPENYREILDERTAAKIAAISDSKERNAALATAQNEQWKNKCISDTYEPGSVFKPITMAAALEEGAATLNSSFYCRGYSIVNGRKIRCASSYGHGSESLTKGMMNSCNPVFMELASRIGAESFYRYFTAFGLTEKTGIDLPGEASGVMHSLSVLKKESDTLAVSSFGQSFKITPLQMITAIAAVSNGGYLVQPHVVSQILDSDGNIVERFDSTVKRQVIAESTSKKINSMLEQTVSGGTAKNGYIAGYRIGGKTGTSEKIEEQAETGVKSYVASYCAIAPSDDPEIVMLVLLDEPNGAAHTGGTIAAPVCRTVLSNVLPYLGIDTIYSTKDVELLDVQAPNAVGQTVDRAKAMLNDKELKGRVIGSGDVVIAQIPREGQSLPKGSTVVLYTLSEEERAEALENADEGDSEPWLRMTTVPDLTGMSPSQANKAVTNANLNIRYAGTGYNSTAGLVVGQSIQEGESVAQGTVITVEFIEGGLYD